MVIQQLIYLNALARERHFGRAAAACHVSQATLSKAIQRLEDEFRVPLVRRGHQFEELTPEGERAVAWAQRILTDCEGMEADLALMHSGTGGKLRLGAIPTSLPVVPRLTGPLRRRHPDLRFAIRSLSSREIERGLQESELDAGLTYLDNEPLHAVRSKRLYEEGYVFIAPSESRWAESESISWEAAAEAPLCLLSPDMQNRRIVDRNFAEAGRAGPARRRDELDLDPARACPRGPALRRPRRLLAAGLLGARGHVAPAPRAGAPPADRHRLAGGGADLGDGPGAGRGRRGVQLGSRPGTQLVPARGTFAIAEASTVRATRSSGSRLWTWDLPQARARVWVSSTIARR